MAAEGDVLKDFLVKLGFDIDENSLGKFTEGITSSTTRIMAFGAAITAAAAGVIASVHEIANEYKQLDLLAKQLKSTTEEVDNFLDTTNALGISEEAAKGSLQAFSKNVADAGLGVGRAKVIFEKLNISVKDANGQMRSSVAVMQDLQEKMKGMDRASQIRIMERLGLDPKLLTYFNDAFGKTAYIGEELNKIDIASGFNLDKAVEQSKSFTKSWKDMTIEINLLKTLFSKMYEAVAVQMMPSIQKGIEKVTLAIQDARRIIMDNAQKIEQALKPILEWILKIGSAFVQLAVTTFKIVAGAIMPIIDLILKVNKATDGWAGYIAAALVAWKAFNLGFLATPLGAILAIGLAILALVDDFMTFQEGGESFLSFWGEYADIIQPVIEVTKEIIGLFENLFMGVIQNGWGIIKNLVSAVMSLINAFRLLMSGDMGGFWNGLIESAKGFLDVIKNIFGMIKSVGDFFSGMSSGSVATAKLGTAVSNRMAGNVQQQTVINVQGGANPQATAQAVAAQQGNVNSQMIRNMRGATK